MNSSEAYELGMKEGMRRWFVGGPVFEPDAIAADSGLSASFIRGVDKGEADARQRFLNGEDLTDTYEQPSFVIIDFINSDTGAFGRVGWCYVGDQRRNWVFEPPKAPVIWHGYQGDDLGNESDFGSCFGTYRRWGPEPRLNLSARKFEAADEGAS